MSNKRFSVRITNDVWRQSTELLLSDRSLETKGFFLCGVSDGASEDSLLVREYVEVPLDAYVRRSAVIVEIAPEFVHSLLVRCASEELALLEIHTHPWAANVSFSAIDMKSDLAKFRVTQTMLPPFRHGALVLGGDLSVEGHLWSLDTHAFQELEALTIVGAPIQTVFGAQGATSPSVDEERFDRQIRMLGPEGQHRLSELRVGLVGCGGLGSQMAQVLSLLGMSQFVLVDPDTLDQSSANRFVGATRLDVAERRAKVDVIERTIRDTHGDEVQITKVLEKIQGGAALPHLFECDVIVGAVDSPSARQFLNVFCVASLIPYVDAGVGLHVADGALSRAGGQVHVILPGTTACRACIHRSSEEEAVEQLTHFQRSAAHGRGYITGADVKNPQVAFLNGVVANMAAWEIVKLFTGVDAVCNYVYYDLLRQMAFVPADVDRDSDCLICSSEGLIGWGQSASESLVDPWATVEALPPERIEC